MNGKLNIYQQGPFKKNKDFMFANLQDVLKNMTKGNQCHQSKIYIFLYMFTCGETG